MNFETVKFFNNDAYEVAKYDQSLLLPTNGSR